MGVTDVRAVLGVALRSKARRSRRATVPRASQRRTISDEGLPTARAEVMSAYVHDPGGLGFRITEIHAFVVAHDDGDEALPAFSLPNGMILPLVAADSNRPESIRTIPR